MRHFEQEITDPAAWLAQDGDGWQCRERLTLSDMPLLLMRDFKETNHCSLTALTSVFTYFRRQGVTGLNSHISGRGAIPTLRCVCFDSDALKCRS